MNVSRGMGWPALSCAVRVAAIAAALSSTAGAESGPAVESKSSEGTAAASTQAALRRAVDDPRRPDDDRARDADRRPYDVMTFFGIAPGMKVADLMCGRGYYGELLGRAVGADGVAYCQNNAFVVRRFADAALKERLARPGLDNVRRVDAELDELPFATESLDVVQIVLFYHDTYWQKVDRAAMNAEVYRVLEPGGIYGVIDHRAEDGSGARDVETLHRVDEELVKREILAAGFVLDAESDLLSHPEDDRTANVFDESIRGKTDRFVLRFRKPPVGDQAH